MNDETFSGVPVTQSAEFTLPATIPPLDEQAMIRLALGSRPDIHAAQALVAQAQAAIRLAKGDRIPSPVLGPEWEIDEAGVQYIGFVWIQPLPILNSGKPLVRQREAEARRACLALQQAQQRAVSQVRSAVARWNGGTELVRETGGLTAELNREVAELDRLFEAGQATLTTLTQARQRLIQLENARLDAIWAAAQAQADLLLALGAPALIRPTDRQAAAAPRPPAAPPGGSP